MDNDGNALVAGALYFNSTAGEMRVWTGSAWTAAYVSGAGVLLIANNLSDLASASAARSNLGLGNVENKSSATIRSEITSGNVTTALGFTPYNSSNPAGYITGITSGNVTTALGYTPANKAGDTFTGNITLGSNWIYMSYNGGDSLRMNAYGYGFDFFNQSQGTWADIRARNAQFNIVYDKDNTAYYVDPSSSGTSANFAGTVQVGSNALSATAPQWSAYFSTHPYGVSSGDDRTHFGYFTGSEYHNYIRGAWTSFHNYITVGGSVRAPIFYDSDNTAYYVDPASGTTSMRTNGAWITNATSAWGGEVAGKLEYHNNRWYASAATGFFVRRTDGADLMSVADGVVTAAQDMRAPIFYDSNNTGYYVDPDTTSNLNSGFTSGQWKFRSNPGSGVYSGAAANLGLQAYSDDGGSAHLAFHRSGYYAVNMGLDPDNYLRIGGWSAAANRWVLDMSGNNWVAGSSRAPVFYDSDNTAHYVDPTGTSTLTTVYARKTAANNTPAIEVRGGNPGYPRIQTYSLEADSNAWMGLGVDMGGTSYEHSLYFPYGTSGQGRLSIGDYNGTAYNPRLWVFTGYTQINNSVRTPIFYDSDNTAYYVDPASTAGNAAYFAGGIHISGANVTGNGLILADDGDIVDMNDGYCSMRFSLGVRIRNGNRTGDPAYELNSVYGSSSLENQRGFVINGNYTDGRYSTRLRKWDDGGGVPLYIQQTTGTAGSWSNVASFGPSNSRYAFHVDGVIYTGSDARAPVFYDANNTGYYVDPNSVSYLQTIAIETERTYLGSINNDYSSGYYHFSNTQDTPTGAYGHAHIIRLSADWNVQMFFPTSNTNEPMWLRRKQNGTYSAWRRLLQEDEWIGNKYLASDGRIYGTILYDSNNSAYYVDPTGDTVLAGNLLISQASNASYIYMGDSDNGQRVIHNNSDRIGFLTQAGGWGSWCEDSGAWLTDHSMQSPIYYDRNDTSTYVDPNGSSWFKGNIYNWRQGPSNDTFGGLELREADGVGNAQTGATYAPGINFHWSNVGAARFYYASNGSFVLAGQNDITNNRRSLFCNEIYASGNVTAYYSDERLKTRIGNIDNALGLVSRLSGFRYVNNDLAKSFGYGGDEVQIGVSAQEVQEVLPEVVKQAAFDVDIDKPEGGSKTGENYLTVDYSRLVPLLIEAIKELKTEVDNLKATVH